MCFVELDLKTARVIKETVKYVTRIILFEVLLKFVFFVNRFFANMEYIALRIQFKIGFILESLSQSKTILFFRAQLVKASLAKQARLVLSS